MDKVVVMEMVRWITYYFDLTNVDKKDLIKKKER